MGGILFLSVLIFLDSHAYAQTAAGQFKVYSEQYGRFSIQVPKDWTISPPKIEQESVVILFDSNNADDVELSVAASDRHTMLSGSDWEQTIRQDNLDLVAQTPGATMIHPTECAKYVIDCNAACSMTYNTTNNGFTQEEMDIDFQTGKQEVFISMTGSPDIFDKYMPIIEQMLNSMKVS